MLRGVCHRGERYVLSMANGRNLKVTDRHDTILLGERGQSGRKFPARRSVMLSRTRIST